VHGLLLAAGAGTRMGRPKALVRDEDGASWLVRGVDALAKGGCTQVTVVLGASAEEALPLLDGTRATAVVAADWESGLSASLRAGLIAATATDADAVVVTLVDLPDVDAEVVARMLEAPPGPTTLRRATYGGRPGHPVVIGRSHWSALIDTAAGDQGARRYLAEHGADEIECGDLATGRDVDRR
jgi:molybdenum cofactor cytidylyltransferase/nicotine blue oxidoreductase